MTRKHIKTGPGDFESCLAVFGGKAGAFSLALLAVAVFCNSKRSPRSFKKALEQAGYANAQLAISDVEKILPFFSSALSAIQRFNENLLKG